MHILNLPHTPQHNGACEQIHRELKAEAELGKGVIIRSLPDAAEAVQGALTRLNTRPRGVLGGKYASALALIRQLLRAPIDEGDHVRPSTGRPAGS
ncbi:MAG: hypothetical protein DRQ55_15395 [Planctomycetota bacterium]|nr:MAG: hypothetical protein DRQ55_15395 [Planctomycetota bacterium]